MSRRLEPCGTPAAYRRHHQRGEPIDDECRAARSRYVNQWRARGWSSCDVDEIAVERAVQGDPPARLTTAEREAVVRRLHRCGSPDGNIAEHLDITADGVWRIRRRLNLPAIPAERRAAA